MLRRRFVCALQAAELGKLIDDVVPPVLPPVVLVVIASLSLSRPRSPPISLSLSLGRPASSWMGGAFTGADD